MSWTRVATAVSAALVFGGFCFVCHPADAVESGTRCKSTAALTDLGQPLPNTSARLAGSEPIKVIAIGSSSTAGAGASSPAAAFPSRLATELSEQYPEAKISVLNRGINGQESGDMLARIKTDVIAERPSLVIWQLGTNSVLRDHDVGTAGSNIETGAAQIREVGSDVVLVDPQFVPRVIAKPEAEPMVRLIDATAKHLKIALFHRFAVMRNWHEGQAIPFEVFTSPDGLHQNDWGYSCWAKLMSAAIAHAVTRPTLSAHMTPPTRPAFIKPPTD
jgi:lysophospholipase L1-like esterase